MADRSLTDEPPFTQELETVCHAPVSRCRGHWARWDTLEGINIEENDIKTLPENLRDVKSLPSGRSKNRYLNYSAQACHIELFQQE